VRIEISWRSVLAIAGLAFGWWLVAQLWEVVLFVVGSLVLAGTLNPVVNWLEARRLRRPLALVVVVLALLLVLAGLGALVVPALLDQVQALVEGAPNLQRRAAEFLAGTPLANYAGSVREATPDQVLAPLAAGAWPVASRAAEVATLAVTAVVMALYLIAERERMLGFAYALLPRRFHVRVARVLLDLEVVVGGYVRGQALTSLCCGIFFFVLLWIVGTPNALALAILAAFADLLPYFGGYVAMLPAILATLALGPVPAAIVTVAIIAYQEFESRLLVPRIYGRTLRLSPAVVMVALLAGAKLLGIVGALLALPIAAAVRVLIEDLRIELPGEVPGAGEELAAEERAEAVYAKRTEGAPAVEAAQVATEIAQRLQTADDAPVEERRDAA
jgi:predicted PurR-regulated permease PerM